MLKTIIANAIGFTTTVWFVWWLWSRRDDRRRFPPEEEEASWNGTGDPHIGDAPQGDDVHGL